MDWKQLILERDGVTPCFARLLGVAGALLLVALAAFQIVKGAMIDLTQFSIGWSALTGTTAAAARIKLQTEDDPDPSSTALSAAAAARDWKTPA